MTPAAACLLHFCDWCLTPARLGGRTRCSLRSQNSVFAQRGVAALLQVSDTGTRLESTRPEGT